MFNIFPNGLKGTLYTNMFQRVLGASPASRPSNVVPFLGFGMFFWLGLLLGLATGLATKGSR